MWGSSYIFMKTATNELNTVEIVSLRFIIASIILSILFFKSILKINLKTFIYGFLLGLLLFIIFILATKGVEYISPSQAAFLVSLTTIFVPLQLLLVKRQRLTRKKILAILLSLTGVSLLTLKSGFHSFNIGHLFCLISGFLYATHIIFTDYLSKKHNAFHLGILQVIFAGVCGAVASIALDGAIVLPNSRTTWVSILFLAIVCSALGFVLQPIAQKYTHAIDMGLIFSLEPVFTSIFSVIMLRELLSSQEIIGGVLILLGTFSVLNVKNTSEYL